MKSTKEELQKIAQALRKKYTFQQKIMKPITIQRSISQQRDSKSNQIDIEMNSESEQEAMNFFQEVHEQFSEKKREKIEEKERKKAQTEIKPQSILVQQISSKEEKSNKTAKTVSIQEERNEIHIVKEQKPSKIKKIKADKLQFEQHLILIKAVDKLLSDNDLSFEEFKDLLSVQAGQRFRQQKLFPFLEKTLPEHKLSNSFNYLRQNIDSFNHTPWKQQQLDKLLELVAKYGRKWKRIGNQIGRSKESVYQRYQVLSQEGAYEQLKNLWKFNQLVYLTTQISRQTSVPFLNPDIIQELDRAEQHDSRESEQFLSKCYRNNISSFHNVEILAKYLNITLLSEINLDGIDWKSITTSLLTKKPLECKNKIIEIINCLFRPQQSLDEVVLSFLKKQKVNTESQISWNHWKNQLYSVDEAKQRYLVLKKLIEGRSQKPYLYIMQQLENKVNQSKKERGNQ